MQIVRLRETCGRHSVRLWERFHCTQYYCNIIATMCAKSESGELCATATVKFLADAAQMINAESCQGAIDSLSCPPACRTFLEVEKTRLDCCINTYINTTHFQPGDDSLYSNADYVDYRLWDLCGVALPAADRRNALPINTLDNAQTCTSEEFLRRLADYECMVGVGQPFIDAVLQNRKCLIYATALVDECAWDQ